MKWPGKALKQLFFLTPHLAQESKRARSKGKKTPSLRRAGDWPRAVGAGPSGEDSCSSLDSIPLFRRWIQIVYWSALTANPQNETLGRAGLRPQIRFVTPSLL